jgi:2-aminoethylphosphonate-pyruvate transaminase
LNHIINETALNFRNNSIGLGDETIILKPAFSKEEAPFTAVDRSSETQLPKRKYLLFTPGPVNVANSVRLAVCSEDICHRETDFDYLIQSVESKLLQLFEVRKVTDFRAVVITGSGTAANETMLSSIVGNKNILILSNGEFGDRLFNISCIHNKNTFLLEFGWGEKLDAVRIKAALSFHKIDVVAMVHHETSSGMLNSLEEVGDLAKACGAKLVVDCVSSVGAEVIDLEKCNISFCSSSSSKAIGSYAGLSFVIGKVEAFEELANLPAKSAYLDLAKFYHFSKMYSQTPNTPAVQLVYALNQALTNILHEGVSNHYKILKDKALFLRKGMLSLGLKFLIHQKDMCSVLTTVYVPTYINVSELRAELRSKSIIIYEGKGCFKNRVFQVGNIGELSFADLRYFLDSLQQILRSFDQLGRKQSFFRGDSTPEFPRMNSGLDTLTVVGL